MAAVAAFAAKASTWLSALPSGFATAASLGGAALTTVGTIQAANAQARAAEFNAATAEAEAAIERQNRSDAIRLANRDVEAKRRENRRLLSSIRASIGSSGLDLAGSPLDVLADTSREAEFDVENIELEGRARANESARRAVGFDNEATLNRNRASSSRTAGYFGGLGSGLSGVGTTLSRVA